MINTELINKVSEVYNWYSNQRLKENKYLFQGEANQITLETIYSRLQWLCIMEYRLSKGQPLRADRVDKINRMHYFGPIKWPQERITKRFELLKNKENENKTSDRRLVEGRA